MMKYLPVHLTKESLIPDTGKKIRSKLIWGWGEVLGINEKARVIS